MSHFSDIFIMQIPFSFIENFLLRMRMQNHNSQLSINIRNLYLFHISIEATYFFRFDLEFLELFMTHGNYFSLYDLFRNIRQ